MRKTIFVVLVIFLSGVSGNDNSAVIQDFEFTAEQEFTVKRWCYLMGQDNYVPYTIPETSTVVVGPDSIKWNMCGNQTVNYTKGENTFFNYDNFKNTECDQDGFDGPVKMRKVL